MNSKAIIAMSGGVDSSVAACLMKQRGFDCIGVTMKLFANEDIGIAGEHSCCSLDDVEDARSVARMLEIPYYVFNFADRFREDVIARFISAYENGRTPNPCIDCNRYLKFDKLYHRAGELGRDFVVTGHYARIERDAETGRYLLKKAVDPAKDQSYVLYALTQEQLAHTLFPLGGMTKPEVRKIAEKQGFINARKHDSQDICFVQNGCYADFIEEHTGRSYPAGNFVDQSGNILGRHRGIIRYTIGQRKGLGLALPEPMYVCAVNPSDNTVVLGKESELYTRELTAKDINLISLPYIEKPIRVKAKVWYRQPEMRATVTQTDADTIRVAFDEPQRAVTAGQAVVLYDGDTVVGGGTIQISI
ncbi:MAG: tRNA 2-thiouridine(34) synthase MnmA [Clostridia bacterium]|nr:tRNA 2-thiouridine(34) synthase MnmA [Clostridia bacterium]